MKYTSLLLVALAFTALSLTVPGCTSSTPAPAQATQKGAAFLQALRNAEYSVDFINTGKARLKDGVFEEPAAPGSATTTRVQLGEERALGDVNGDGAEDAAVTLWVQPGGTGTFHYVAVVINEKGMPKPLAPEFLGDRIIVKSLAIQPGKVVVTLLERRPDEPMTAKPTIEVTRTFKLQGGKLVEVK